MSWKGSDVQVLLEKSPGYSGGGCERCHMSHNGSVGDDSIVCRPPVVCEDTDEAYLLLQSDTTHVTFSQDSPGEGMGVFYLRLTQVHLQD